MEFLGSSGWTTNLLDCDNPKMLGTRVGMQESFNSWVTPGLQVIVLEVAAIFAKLLSFRFLLRLVTLVGNGTICINT